jgi:hypothetical protein
VHFAPVPKSRGNVTGQFRAGQIVTLACCVCSEKDAILHVTILHCRYSLLQLLPPQISQLLHPSTTRGVASSSKLGAAQAELQACESHLAAKEKELDRLRVLTVQRGLQARCKAMVECGWNWGEMGKEGLRALEGMENSAAHGNDG